MRINFTLNIKAKTDVNLTLPNRPTDEEMNQVMKILTPLLALPSGMNLNLQPAGDTVAATLPALQSMIDQWSSGR